METVTFTQSAIRGSVAGKTLSCMVRSSPAGLTLPAGHYLLLPAVKNPVYGLVMSIQPIPGPAAGPSSIKFQPPGALAHKFAPSAVKVGAPSEKIDFAPSIKFDAPASPRDVAAPGTGGGSLVVCDKAIAGNCLVVTSGFAELVDAVQRAGGVTLIVT